MYQEWKSKVLDKVIGDGQCVSLVVNNPESYTAALFPNVSWEEVMAPVALAYQLQGKSNQYLTWVENDHNDANQLPSQGDIMVFGPTPASGYTDTFENPGGHCGVCDSATTSGYVLLSQDSPATGDAANVYGVPWKYRPCEGWYTINGSTPAPDPTSTVETITLPATTGPWHLYAPGFAGNMEHVLGLIEPETLHEALTYPIIESLGNGVYRIKSDDYGVGDLWTNGSDVIIK